MLRVNDGIHFTLTIMIIIHSVDVKLKGLVYVYVLFYFMRNKVSRFTLQRAQHYVGASFMLISLVG